MPFPTPKYKHHNRFSEVNPGRMNKRFFYAHFSDSPDPKPDEKFTLDEAKAKLKESGFAIMPQKSFDQIVDEKYGKGFNKGKEEAVNELSDEQKKWKDAFDNSTKLQKKLDDLEKEKPDMVSKSEHEALLKVERDKLEAAGKQITGLREKEKENSLLKAINGKAIDPGDVIALNRDKFQMDENGNVYPVDEKGEKLIDADGHMTVERYFDKFFKDKPHLAKATGTPGAGSSSTGGGNQTDSGKLSLEQLSEMSEAEFIKAGGMGAAGSS